MKKNDSEIQAVLKRIQESFPKNNDKAMLSQMK